MSSCSVLTDDRFSSKGVNYLVPQEWWKKYSAMNQREREGSSFLIPLNLAPHSDSILLEFKDDLLDELEFKSNYLKFQSLKISLEPLPNTSWAAIASSEWKKIAKHHNNIQGIITILEQDKHYDVLETMQVQIIFCSKNKSHAFVGYLPKKANLAFSIRQIGFEMGFVEVVRSKIAYLDKNPEISFAFHDLERYTIENGPGTSFMAFNMERSDQDSPVQRYPEINIFEKLANESNEAVAGDMNTMEDESNNHLNEPINNRTMSTGAETPFSFALSQGFDLDREYRVKQLFGAKQPEQIEDLMLLANSKIEDQANLIELPIVDEESFQRQLDKMAEELIEGFLKKRIHREKEKELQLLQ